MVSREGFSVGYVEEKAFEVRAHTIQLIRKGFAKIEGVEDNTLKLIYIHD